MAHPCQAPRRESVRGMEWLSRLKEFHLVLDLPGHGGVCPGNLQDAPRRFQCLGKLPVFGKGDGEDVKNIRIFPAGQRIGVPGQFDCAGSIPQRRIR